MFESLSNFIVETIHLLFKTKTVPETSMYIAFLRLFDSLFKLENASKAAYKEFRGYADGTEIPIKTIFRSRLFSLLTACREFIEHLEAMSSILVLYNQKLFVALGGVSSGKKGYLKAIYIFLETCPTEAQEIFLVNYPIDLSLDSFASYDFSQHFSKDLGFSWEYDNQDYHDLLKKLGSQIKKMTVDLRILNQSQTAFKKAEQNIQAIEYVRQELADYIRDNFPLNKILKSGNSYTEMNFHGSVANAVGNVTGNNQQSNRTNTSNYNLQHAQFAGGLVDAETVNAHQIGGNITNNTQAAQTETNDSAVKTILILASNPRTTASLRLDEEVREIDAGLQRARKRELFDLKQRWAVRIQDVYQSLLDFNPSIVHFSGHGSGDDGLVLEDENGQVRLVETVALAGLFEVFANRIECVVLNACYSEVQAGAIAQHIPYVVGMSQAIGDKAAIKFATGFYSALGSGESVEFAYKLGCSVIQLDGIAKHLTPILKRK
jgi:hypothetical protein